MAYRDELSAARARIGELERQLDEAKQRIAELEQDKKRVKPPTNPVRPQPRQLAGKLHYHPPWSYVPLLHVLKLGLLGAIRVRVPKSSDYLIAHVLRYVVLFPIFYLLFIPGFYLFCIPYFTVLALALTPVTALWVALAGLRFGARPRPGRRERPEWLQKPESAVFAIFMTMVSTGPVFGPIGYLMVFGPQ